MNSGFIGWSTRLLLTIAAIAISALVLVNTASAQTACTMDAMICPDGTAVGRTGPKCEFAACPGTQTGKPLFNIQTSIETSGALRATVTRTDTLTAGTCGPQFVGKIVWGDGTTTEQPTNTTRECGSNKSISASHIYKTAGNFNIVVSLDNTVRLQKTVAAPSIEDDGSLPKPQLPDEDSDSLYKPPVVADEDTGSLPNNPKKCSWWRIWGVISPCDPAQPPQVSDEDTGSIYYNGDTNWITNTPKAVNGYIKSVFNSIARPIMGVIPYVKGMFGMNGQNTNGGNFVNLPNPQNNGYTPGVRTINDIKATVVNQSLTREASCQSGQGSDKFEAYVVTTQGEIVINDCSNGTAPADYAKVIVANLSSKHGFSGLTVDALLKKAFQIGGASGTKPGYTSGSGDTTSGDAGVVNNLDIGLQIKVADKTGKVVKDWSTNNVVIDSTDQIYLRWNADKFTQCLPFFADNGQYAFSKLNSKLVAGNTETEKFNLTERSGPYLLECASKVNAFDVQTAIIYVTVKSNTVSPSPDISGLPVQPSSNFKVAVSNTNSLSVSITRTVPSGQCGPKYVGTIDWGDGTVDPQPEAVTMECGSFTSTSATHTYKTGGQYTVSVKLDGVTAMVTQVTVFAPFDAPN